MWKPGIVVYDCNYSTLGGWSRGIVSQNPFWEISQVSEMQSCNNKWVIKMIGSDSLTGHHVKAKAIWTKKYGHQLRAVVLVH